MVSRQFLLAQGEIPVEAFRVEVIPECQVFAMGLQLVFIPAQQQKQVTQEVDSVGRLLLISVAHLTICIIYYIAFDSYIHVARYHPGHPSLPT